MGCVTAVQGRRRVKLDIISEGSLRVLVWIGDRRALRPAQYKNHRPHSYPKTLPLFRSRRVALAVWTEPLDWDTSTRARTASWSAAPARSAR